MRKITSLTLISVSFLILSCADSSRSRERNLELLTPGQNGGACSSQVTGDLQAMNDMCDVKGYNWQKHDILMNCLEEVNSIRISYPDLNCKVDGKKKTSKATNELYAQIKNRIYQYKTGTCGSEPIQEFNQHFENYDSSDAESRKKLSNNLDDFADRYKGINCETKENEIKISSKSTKIKLTRELINKMRSDITKETTLSEETKKESTLIERNSVNI